MNNENTENNNTDTSNSSSESEYLPEAGETAVAPPVTPIPDPVTIPTGIDETPQTDTVPASTSVSGSDKEPAAQMAIDDPIIEPGLKVEARHPQNVYIDGPLTGPAHDPDINIPGIALPSESDRRMSEVLNQMPEISIGGSVQGRRWESVARNALGMGTFDDTFTQRLEDLDAEFHQYVQSNGEKIRSIEIGFKERQNSRFDGELAVLRAMAHLGLGTTFSVALWNTGIWVTFKPPSEQALLELYRQLTSDQIELGRSSWGLVYSNTSVYVIERLCNFAREHIFHISSNKEEINIDNILDHIKAQDISSFLWGLACTMYPQGFDYNRACMVNPDKCQHVVKERINVRKLQMVDKNALTEWQRTHMASNRVKKTIGKEALKKYEQEMVRASARTFHVNEGEKNEIQFTLRSPSISQYLESGHRWVDEIVRVVEQALGNGQPAEEKNHVIDLKSRATILRQYSHWIASIVFDTNTVDDQGSVEQVIDAISSDQTIREAVLTEVKKFIENSSVSVIAIPTYDCPACGEPNEGPKTYPHRQSLIPIDVTQLFFVLLTQKHLELRNR